MTKKIIFGFLGALVLAAIILAIRAKTWINQVKYGVATGVKPLKIGFNIIKVYMPIYFYNPTPFTIVASNLDVKILFDSHYVSRIKSPSNYKLISKQNSTYPLTVNVDPKEVINLLAERGEIINDPDWLKKVKVTVIGTVTLDVGLFKLNKFPIEFTDSLKYYVG